MRSSGTYAARSGPAPPHSRSVRWDSQQRAARRGPARSVAPSRAAVRGEHLHRARGRRPPGGAGGWRSWGCSSSSEPRRKSPRRRRAAVDARRTRHRHGHRVHRRDHGRRAAPARGPRPRRAASTAWPTQAAGVGWMLLAVVAACVGRATTPWWPGPRSIQVIESARELNSPVSVGHSRYASTSCATSSASATAWIRNQLLVR